jgi:hypothetical protein
MYVFVCTGNEEHTSYSASQTQIEPGCPKCGAPTMEVRGLDKHPIAVREDGGTKIDFVLATFDDKSRNWSEDPDINKLFCQSVLNFMADRLKAHGFLFLNEVYNELGLPRTSEGQLVGWLYSEKETWWVMESSTDGPEKDRIILKFYTHGVMYDKIEES